MTVFIGERVFFVLGVHLQWLEELLDTVSVFATLFLGIFIQAVPFLLLGTFASGLVTVYVSEENLSRMFPQHPFWAALTGSFMGLFLPVGECGVVPLVRRLIKKGIPLPAGIAFLLAAPTVNPIVIATTWAVFGFSNIFWARIIITILIAVTIALIFSLQTVPRSILRKVKLRTPVNNIADENIVSMPTPPIGKQRRYLRVLQITGDDFFEMGRFLAIGAFLAAVLQTIIPQQIILNAGHGPLNSVGTLIIMAVLLSVCSNVDAFIAFSYTGVFPTGALLAFLVFGSMVDIKSVLMYRRLFRDRVTAYIILLSLLMVLVITTGINYFAGW